MTTFTISQAKRRAIFARDGLRCHYCKCLCYIHKGNPPLGPCAATIDHKKPRSEGGSNHPSNLVTACNLCNNRKGCNPYSINIPPPFVQDWEHTSQLARALARKIVAEQERAPT